MLDRELVVTGQKAFRARQTHAANEAYVCMKQHNSRLFAAVSAFENEGSPLAEGSANGRTISSFERLR
jgi:hypothetical protein